MIRTVPTFLFTLGILFACPIFHVSGNAATTSIDFETPRIGDAPSLVVDSYAVSGATFRWGTMGLIKECIVDACGPCTNQLLGAARSPGCPIGTGGSVNPLVVSFQPEAGTVTVVSLDYRTYLSQRLVLNLYNAAGAVVGSAEGVEIGDCPDYGDLSARGFVRAVSAEPVAYVMSWAFNWTCPGIPPCEDCNPFAIDNLTFGDCLDEAPPSLTVAVSPETLWPPNHRLATVQATTEVEDDCDEAPQVRLLSIISDELDSDTGAEDLPGDIQGADIGTPDFEFALRAERAEEGDGRTYTVCYEAQDAAGNTAQACTTVNVPHDRSGKTTFAASGRVRDW